MNTIAEFDLQRPTTLPEAARLLAADGARAVAGGTDLLPNLARGIGRPSLLVDLGGVAGFDAIDREGTRWRIGAGVTLAAIERSAELAAALPALVQAAREVAGPGHRSAATLGGNLCQDTRCIYYNQSEWWRAANGWCLKLEGDTCHVAPHGHRCHAAFCSDIAPALLAYHAEAEIATAHGVRHAPLAELYRDDGAAHLTLRPGELLAAVLVGAPHPGTASAYRKARVRGAMDFPLAGVAVALRMQGGVLAEFAVGIAGTNSYPLRLDTDALVGRAVDDVLLAELGKRVAKQVGPMRSTVIAANHRRVVAVATAQRLVRELASA